MENFGDYAYYYNLLYKNKNYGAEAKQIDFLLNKYGCGKKILNLGCGTGRHDIELSKLGYHMTGVDMSADMIQVAKSNKESLKYGINFEVADARNYKTSLKYDAVIFMFHVMSYMTSNEDISRAFSVANSVLPLGGLLIFDAWYGPGVLTEKPAERVKQVEDETNYIYRYAHPEMQVESDVVDVHYDVIIVNKESGKAQKISEVHRMRYFFVPEIDMMLDQAGFELEACLDCNTLEKTDFRSWTAYFIAKKRG